MNGSDNVQVFHMLVAVDSEKRDKYLSCFPLNVVDFYFQCCTCAFYLQSSLFDDGMVNSGAILEFRGFHTSLSVSFCNCIIIFLNFSSF